MRSREKIGAPRKPQIASPCISVKCPVTAGRPQHFPRAFLAPFSINKRPGVPEFPAPLAIVGVMKQLQRAARRPMAGRLRLGPGLNPKIGSKSAIICHYLPFLKGSRYE